MRATITIIADSKDTPGILISMATGGDFADESVDRRFYSITDTPPASLPAVEFWGVILREISGHLITAGGEIAVRPDDEATS